MKVKKYQKFLCVMSVIIILIGLTCVFQLSRIPRKYCEIKKDVIKVELQQYNTLYFKDYPGLVSITCEIGVDIYDNMEEVVNWERSTKTCLVKTRQKICEIK